jgi:hypothetical protein
MAGEVRGDGMPLATANAENEGERVREEAVVVVGLCGRETVDVGRVWSFVLAEDIRITRPQQQSKGGK